MESNNLLYKEESYQIMKASQLKLGILINFGATTLEYHRIPASQNPTQSIQFE